MRKLCFNPTTASFAIARHSLSSLAAPSTASPSPRPSPRPSRLRITEPTRIDAERCIEEAKALILKWNAETSAFAEVTSLFYEDKTEAQQYINCVNQLQKAMHSLLSINPSSIKLIHAQNLMQMAMKRLKKEFYQILSMNRAHLDPESVSARSSRASVHSNTSDYDDDNTTAEDEIRAAGDSISEVEHVSSVAMADLRSIADCMVSSGYTKECVTVYNSIRKSIVDEGIYRLNVEKLSSTRVNKMDWEVLEMKIKSWLEAVWISVRTLFHGERILCDHVFGGSSESVRESCFAEITRDGAALLFGFPELVAKTKKSSPPEKMFRVLDMYAVVSSLLPEIESIFSSDYTSAVRSQVFASLQRLIESVQTMLSEFESTIHKDASKLPVNGGGVHLLAVQTMNYLSILADYNNVLSDIFLPPSPKSSPLPESYLYSPDQSEDSTSATPALTARVAWLILVLLCKLDRKAKQFKEVSLSYLFLANNLRHVVARVRGSNLMYVLGEDWITKHEGKVKWFVSKYERVAWGEVVSSLPENPNAAEARAVFEKFNLRFEEAYRKQNTFVIADRELRDEIKGSIARNIVPRYREWYNTVLATVGSARDMAMMEYVIFTPEDVDNYLSNLFFFGTCSSAVSSSSSVTSSPHRRRS